MKKGSRHTMESRLRIAATLRTKEVRDKIIAANVGSKRTDKTRQNISLGLKRMWQRKRLRESPQITLQSNPI